MPLRPDKNQLNRTRAREIGRGLKRLRQEHRLTQQQVGPLSAATVEKLEQGELNSTFYVLDNYVRVFGVEAVEKAMGWRL